MSVSMQRGTGALMKITTLRLSNFQSFGPERTTIDLDDMTYVLGPNGSGKTAVLEALSRLFSPLAAQRKIRLEDFHARVDQSAGEAQAEEPNLWLEVDVEFPEARTDEQHASIPPNFSHMAINSADGVPRIRVRLTASLAPDSVIDEKIEYVLEADEAGEPTRNYDMSRYERGHIEVHYLPARRDPADHIAYTTASLIGRTLRAADWTTERETLGGLTAQITASLIANTAVASIGARLTDEWRGLHRGAYFKDPSIAFGRGELEGVLRQTNRDVLADARRRTATFRAAERRSEVLALHFAGACLAVAGQTGPRRRGDIPQCRPVASACTHRYCAGGA